MIGIKVMRCGLRLNGSNLACVLLGVKKVILWPLLANLLHRWRNAVWWPRASHGYIAMCKERESMATKNVDDN